jgi:peptidoglycan/xylan/chitin deacetylase (PgdA/CDA1 family)
MRASSAAWLQALEFSAMNLNLTVLMYHYVRDAGDAAEAGSGIRGMSKQKFCAQVDTIARTYEMVSWKDVREAVLEKKPLPERACLLTFDDGVCDHYWNVFPELARRKLSGLFFALARAEDANLPLPFKLHFLIARLGLENLRAEIWNRLNESQRAIYREAEVRYRLRGKAETDVVKGIFQRDLADAVNPLLSELIAQHIGSEQELARQLFLNDAQIKEMRAGGMHFGGHSATHPWFDFISPAQRADEIRASREGLTRVEQPPFAFAYPYGGLADDAPQLFQQNHFCAAFTTRASVTHADPFYIGRFDGEEWQ